MNYKDSGPAIQKAYSFLKSNLDKGVWQTGDRLPSKKTLANAAGVSPASLLKAVALLKGEGLIHGIERGPIRAGAERQQAAIPSEKSDTLWRMKRVALEKDILSGMYARQGKLPSCKELQHRYGCSYATLRKILRSMVADSAVVLRGKSYVLSAYTPRQASGRIVFITHRGTFLLSAFNKSEHLVVDTLEGECIRRGLSLEVIDLDFYDSLEIPTMIMSDRMKIPALGYVLDIWWFASEEMRNAYICLLERLTALKSPIAIINQLGTFVLPAQFTLNPNVQVFIPEGKRAGSRMARHLIGMGHQAVAYISMSHMLSWSQERLEGIRSQFSQVGLNDAIVPVVMDTIDVAYLHILAMSGLTDSQIQKIVTINMTKSQARDTLDTYLKFKKRWTPKQFRPKDVLDYQKNFANLALLLGRKMSKDFFDAVYSAFAETGGSRMVTMALIPLFQQALNNRAITAWICANDSVALAALSFLRERGISVPDTLSVVGFDNISPEPLAHRLTTFDFNVSGAIHNMLNFIVHPPRQPKPYRHSLIEIEGLVVQRETSAPPRK